MKRVRDALELHPEEGKLTILGERFWLAHNAEFISLRRKLEETMGRAANGFVYREGEQTGAAYTKFLRTSFQAEIDPLDTRGRFEYCLGWLSRVGYGRFRLESFHPDRNEARVVLENSIEAESYGPAQVTVCYVTAGILGHIAGLLGGVTALASEVACRSTGSDRCEFEIRKTK